VIIELYTKDKTLQPEILKRVNVLENDQEYYVRKAVTWIKGNIKKGK
jgi:3-methyladenine DNA glycosylase AlkD